MKQRYGIEPDVYDALRAAAGGSCEACGAVTDELGVDFDHHLRVVRGLLCRRCGFILGRLRDPGVLDRIAAYLRDRHQ